MRPSIARSVESAASARSLVTQRPRDDRLIHLVLTRPLTNPFEPSPTCPTQAKCLWPATMLPRSPKTSSEIDEAHLLDNQQLEAIRMLTNHDMDSGSPFAAVLIGQPTLRHRLRLGVLAALDQRVSVRYALAGMTAQDTAGYLTHHLKIAGRADTLFSGDAVTVIHNAARGYPRAVNNLAINALTAAFARKSAIVDEKAARIAVTENGGD